MNTAGRFPWTIALISGLFAGILFLSPIVSFSAGQGDLEKVTTTKICEGCDLRRANFSGKDLSGANLSGSFLIGANLRGANLTRANLSRAIFVDAVLSDSNLTGANLTRADLGGAYIVNVNLSDANLSEAIWTDGTTCKKGSVGKCER